MAINASQYAQIEPYLPRQRGNVSIANRNVINALLYVAGHGCKWRGLPKHYGRWHTIYMRMQRWAQKRSSAGRFQKSPGRKYPELFGAPSTARISVGESPTSDPAGGN